MPDLATCHVLMSRSGLVRASDLGFRYGRGGTAALGGVNFEWPVGLVALMGPNGAGKSTLLRLIIGDLKPSGGSLTVGARVVGYVPQQADWPGRFTVTDFLTYLCWLQGVPRRRWAERIGQAVAAVDLAAVADARLDSLSGGLRRRAMIAQALLSDPELLVLDEPSAGLDPRQRIQLRTPAVRVGGLLHGGRGHPSG